MVSYRLTTNGLLHTYRSNLQGSFNTLGTAAEKVQTGRKFLSYAEDPASATLAFQLRREHWQASAQKRNNSTVEKSFQQAFSSFDMVKNKIASETAHVNSLRGLNDPDGTARRTLGQSTLEAAKSAVQTMNVKYGEKFLFAGADGKNAPFDWKEVPVEKQQVYDPETMGADIPKVYAERTQKVDADGKPIIGADGNPEYYEKGDPMKDAEGNQLYYQKGELMLDDKGDPLMETVMEEKLCFRGVPVDSPEKLADGTDNPDYLKLKEMMAETTYVDIGLGMQEAPDGSPIKSTVYNSALSGLQFTDFGLDEDGDPKNAISLMNEIGKLLQEASDMDGQWHKVEGTEDEWTNSSEAYDRLFKLTAKLEKAMDKMDVEYTELDTKAAFLQTNETRLTTEIKELNEQILDVEEIDPVEAITALSWAQYCYNAGLKIGNSILSQSLIDYMN